MLTPRCYPVRILYALVMCGLTALPALAADKPVKVFILSGQSNMVGHGKTRDGLNPEYDPSQPLVCMASWVQAGEVGNRVTNGCGDAARTDVSASIVPATATVRCP